MNRRFGTGRSELHYPMILITRVIDIQSKAEFLVERFRTIDIGNRDDHDFELHIHRSSFCHCHNSSFEFQNFSFSVFQFSV